MQPPTQGRPSELRYRIADFINDRLKVMPGVHAAAKAAVSTWLRKGRTQPDGQPPRQVTPAAIEGTPTVPAQHATAAPAQTGPGIFDEPPPATQEISLDKLPIPPYEMRVLVGPTDEIAFDNPSRRPVYDYLDEALYDKVFDFGCGCGRVARQLIQQRPSPKEYVGVDLHAGMIRWCQRNLQPAAPNFSFLHHDVFNVCFNPNRNSPTVANFPVGDSQFTLVNALSVFTHVTEEQAVHYLRECARILHPDGVLHASWFLFQKREFPMMRPEVNALYISYVDPSAAVLFDRDWVRKTARRFGLRICQIVPPQLRGHQWVLVMSKKDVEEVEFPEDRAAYGTAAPEVSSRTDVEKIGLT